MTSRSEAFEIAWLIERSAGPHWWTAGAWSADSLQAVRFTRKADAEQVIDRLGIKNAIATEHMWGGTSAPGVKVTRIDRGRTKHDPNCKTCHGRGEFYAPGQGWPQRCYACGEWEPQP